MAKAELDPVSRLKRLVKPVFSLIAAAFVVLVARDMASRFDGLNVSIHWGWLILAAVPGVLSILLQFQAWWVVVESWTGRAMPRRAALRAYIDGQLARYTPGKVGLLAVRLAHAKTLGVSAQGMVTTLLGEVLAWAACGTIIAGLLVLEPSPAAAPSGALILAHRFLGYLGALSALGLLLLVTLPQAAWPQVLRRMLGERSGPLLPVTVPGWFLLHFLTVAASGACVVLSLGGDGSDAVYLGAVVCAATVAGFVAVLAPAGLGVREATIAVFAEPLLGTGGAVALSLISRAVSLASELILFVSLRAVAGPRPAPHGS